MADDQTLKIEIVDRQYANSPTKRILNATEADSGWAFADPIITDASFTIGGTKDTLLKYIFNPESDFVNPGGGGGGGGSSRRLPQVIPIVISEGPSIPDEPAFEESLLIGIVLVAIVGVAFFTKGGTPSKKRKSSLGKSTKSNRGKSGFR